MKLFERMCTQRYFRLGCCALVLSQLVVFSALIANYESVRLFGVTCRFPCTGIDPYSPFRGKYIRLNVLARAPTHSCAVASRPVARYAIQIDPTGGAGGCSKITRVAEKPSAEGVWAVLQKSRVCIYPGEYVPLPKHFFVNEKVASSMEKMIRSLSQTNTTDLVAVYRVKHHKILLTDVQYKGESLASFIRRAADARAE